MITRLQWKAAKGAWVSAGLLLAAAAVVITAVAAVMQATGASLGEACWAVGPGAGWGGFTFACGWWVAMRRRERVGAEVAVVLAPVLKELKHLRCSLARRGSVDESAKTGVHPRRAAPASDDAVTLVASYDQVREAVQ